MGGNATGVIQRVTSDRMSSKAENTSNENSSETIKYSISTDNELVKIISSSNITTTVSTSMACLSSTRIEFTTISSAPLVSSIVGKPYALDSTKELLSGPSSFPPASSTDIKEKVVSDDTKGNTNTSPTTSEANASSQDSFLLDIKLPDKNQLFDQLFQSVAPKMPSTSLSKPFDDFQATSVNTNSKTSTVVPRTPKTFNSTSVTNTVIGKTPPISSIEVKESSSLKPLEKIEHDFPSFQSMGDLSDSDSDEGISAPIMENILSALSPPSTSTSSTQNIPLPFGTSNNLTHENTQSNSSEILSNTEKGKPPNSKFSSIFDLPTNSIPSNVGLGNTSKTDGISLEHKKSGLEKPEPREKKTPSPKLKETWLVNQTPKQKERKKCDAQTPLRIPKITIKDNFRNELPPKNKESNFSTPPLKITLHRTYDGEWTTSEKKKKKRDKIKKIKPVMISLLKSPDKGRRSPCLIIRKENLVEKENKSNIKIKIRKTPQKSPPILKKKKKKNPQKAPPNLKKKKKKKKKK